MEGERRRAMPTRPIIIVQGAQWGSEAKGAIAAFLCKRESVTWAVRTGAINAGHTVYYNGKPYSMQQIPTGWTNPETMLMIGPGAFINDAVLRSEIATISHATGKPAGKRVFIDWRAGLHTDEHQGKAKEAGRTVLVGATGKGCSEALMAKIRDRGKGYKLYTEAVGQIPTGLVDSVVALNKSYDAGGKILLEGTQGTMLDLHIGPYPYTTHKQCTASEWVTEAGLSPALDYEVVLVARTNPIRVAGNSGPMETETDWPRIARDINKEREMRKLEPLVKEESIQRYKIHLDRLWEERAPDAPENPAFWDSGKRKQWAKELREIPTEAFRSLPLEVQLDLMAVFEVTTITKKIRRVATWDWDLMKYSCAINRPAYVAITFMNHLMPELWHVKDKDLTTANRLSLKIKAKALMGGLKYPVRYVTLGPEEEHVVTLE